MRYIIYLTIALMPFLSGCSTTNMGVAGDYRLNAQGDKGLAVLSVRLDDQCGTGINTFQIDYSRPGTSDYPRFFLLKDMFVKNDFENPPGFFYVQELPAGQYAFTEISEVSPGMRQGAIQPPMTFRVDAGKAQYLGEMNVTFTCKDRDPFLATVMIKDERQRDAGLFAARMTKLSAKDLEYSIMHR